MVTRQVSPTPVLREIPIGSAPAEEVEIREQCSSRSTFDWAVCSEPLARMRRTRAYGYSIVSTRFIAGGKCELALKSAIEARKTDIIFAAYGSLRSNK
jgi:hypothetical protein